MTDVLKMLAEVSDYSRFCREWGIPLSFDDATRADLQEIEDMAREYLKQHATSQPQPEVKITEEEIPW